MKDRLFELISKIQIEKRLEGFDEAATKQAVVLRILNCLQWDSYNIDEVLPEYTVEGKRVDFSLRHGNFNKVFIEVKRIGKDLEKHQKQLLEYSFHMGVKLATLTNGITWWFYLPLNEGSWEQRKFFTIEIYDQDANEISQRFIDFLSKENIISGRALVNAEKMYKGRQKNEQVKATMPKAWKRIIEEENDGLIEIIAETTEKMCGHKPDAETVAGFISTIHCQTFPITLSKKIKVLPKTTPENSNDTSSNTDYSGKTIQSFVFLGKRYNVGSWKALLMEICTLISQRHRESFDKVLNLQGRKRHYFTREPNELRAPCLITGTSIYAEVNLSSNRIVKIIHRLFALFGYSVDDFSIYTD
jgi:hypothetical protein